MSALGQQFPDEPEYREMYLANDGDDGEPCGVLLGFHYLSLHELVYEWKSWAEYADDADMNRESSFTSTPEGRIKRRYADKGWIPLCADGGGNFIGIDLDPDVKGRAGQIINFGRDEHNKAVLEVDLNAFLDRLTRIVRSDDFVIGEMEGEEIIFFGSADEEEGCEHLTDYLLSEDSVK